MPRIMKTTVIDNKIVIVKIPHESTTSQGTQAAQGKKKKPRFLPRKKKKPTPKVYLTMKHKKASMEEEGLRRNLGRKMQLKRKHLLRRKVLKRNLRRKMQLKRKHLKFVRRVQN